MHPAALFQDLTHFPLTANKGCFFSALKSSFAQALSGNTSTASWKRWEGIVFIGFNAAFARPCCFILPKLELFLSKDSSCSSCQASLNPCLRDSFPHRAVTQDTESPSAAWCQNYCGACEPWALGAGRGPAVSAGDSKGTVVVQPTGMGYSQGIPLWRTINEKNLLQSKSGA